LKEYDHTQEDWSTQSKGWKDEQGQNNGRFDWLGKAFGIYPKAKKKIGFNKWD
jgi:hypothetical protein